jgi:hypothetical protein
MAIAAAKSASRKNLDLLEKICVVPEASRLSGELNFTTAPFETKTRTGVYRFSAFKITLVVK